MKTLMQGLTKAATASATGALSVALIVGLAMPTAVSADEADARRLLKAMSDYLAAQEALSFDYDAILEVVTKEEQKLGLASSGSVKLNRPDKVHASRSGGFAEIEMLFDGKTLTLLGKTSNIYTQVDVPGTVDHLVDELRVTYGRPLPGADLLMSNVHDELMRDVIDVKDLGSGVVGGMECDHLAFRTEEVDWQIWIAQGDHPYPCRYVITSKRVTNGPQYSIQIRNWTSGGDVATDGFAFENATAARQIELEELRAMRDMQDLPEHFVRGDGK